MILPLPEKLTITIDREIAFHCAPNECTSCLIALHVKDLLEEPEISNKIKVLNSLDTITLYTIRSNNHVRVYTGGDTLLYYFLCIVAKKAADRFDTTGEWRNGEEVNLILLPVDVNPNQVTNAWIDSDGVLSYTLLEDNQ